MGNITYYVAIGFRHDEEGELVALEPMEARSSAAAVSRARTASFSTLPVRASRSVSVP